MKVIDELKTQVEVQMYKLIGRCKEYQYKKITPLLKSLLIYKVMRDRYTVKDAARLLEINYTSAKNIVNQHKNAKQSISDKPIANISNRVLHYNWNKFMIHTICGRETTNIYTLSKSVNF